MEIFPWDTAEVQTLSATLFGNRHRLEVALAIALMSQSAPDKLYRQALADLLEIRDPEVEKQLRVFRKIGLIEKHPNPPPPPAKRGPGRPPIILRKTSDHFWECLQELGDRFRRPPAA
jgi:hypothetical protein